MIQLISIDKLKKFNYNDLLIFLIPFIIFAYYLYIFNPGILTYDSYNQLHQIATNNFSNWHPFFHTFIEMLCLKIYENPISIGLFQISVFSIIWMVICKYNRVDDGKINKIFICQVIFTLIISLIPINAIYSITLWKDILFSYFLLFLCFLIEVMLDKNYQLNYKFIIILSLIMAFVCQLRPNGILIICALLIIISIYLFKINKKQKNYILIPILTIIFILFIASLNIVYDVEDNQKDAIFDKTSHILSYYDLNVNISEEDHKIINELISEKDIQENFDIYFTDPTYHVSNNDIYNSHKDIFIKLVIKYSLTNPLNFVKYFFKSSSIVWDISRGEDWSGYVYYMDNEAAEKLFYKKSLSKTAYENGSFENYGSIEFNNLKSFAEYFTHNKLLDTMFNSPAFYMYLSFIIMGIIYLITSSKRVFFVYLPNMLNILIIMVSTPIQSNRYLYANILLFYLMVIILLRVLKTKKDTLKIFN